MKSIAISGSLRKNVGKRDAKELRYQGLVPAVLYGGNAQYHFAVSAADLNAAIYTPDIDFLELFDDKPVSLNVPIKLTGTSPGVKMGGKLVQKLRKLKVNALPGDIPQYIEVSLEPLEVGKSTRVGQIKLDNARILNNADDTIVSVIMSRALRQAEQEAAKAEKGKKK
jgi:large subunit ribosomal protein L25